MLAGGGMSQGFLAGIVRDVQAELTRGAYTIGTPEPGRRPVASLRDAVTRAPSRRGVVVEYKRASPGRAEPRLPRRSVAEFVRTTDLPEVVGYSCLATAPKFEGSPELVRELASATDRPVLFKDFVIDRRQLSCARETGAAAVLLIARLERQGLLDRTLTELAEEAHALGLEVLLELHDVADFDLARRVAWDLLGVNVRDLDTLALDRAAAARTMKTVRAHGARPLLGLSGVEGAAEAGAFWQAGCDALVVGSAVALSRDPASFLRSLVLAGAAP